MGKHYFISDLHLGASYITDARAHERRVVDFLDAIKQNAESLFLLGDVLDYWFEYRNVVPRGHIRFFGKLAELADAGVRIYWFTGNHDVWLRDYLRDEVGLEVHYGHTEMEVDGTTLFLSHGDDVGRQPTMYRILRWCFYNPVCQWLYATIHPRWTTWVATGWSAGNRTSRSAEQLERSQTKALDHLREFAENYSASHPQIDAFVFGHLHVADCSSIGDHATMVCLGDWLTQDTYAVMEHGAITLHRWPNSPTDKE